MPCSDLAVLLKAKAQHGLWGIFPLSASSGYHTELKIVIRSIPILLTTIHTYDCKVWYQHTTKDTIC
jgi:hypothetical protein